MKHVFYSVEFLVAALVIEQGAYLHRTVDLVKSLYIQTMRSSFIGYFLRKPLGGSLFLLYSKGFMCENSVFFMKMPYWCEFILIINILQRLKRTFFTAGHFSFPGLYIVFLPGVKYKAIYGYPNQFFPHKALIPP